MISKLKEKDNIIWIIIQQIGGRLLIAFKFFLLARLLGPESIGLITVALIALAMIEALTEIGLMQAIVNRTEGLNRKLKDILWTFQLFRGVAISLILLLFVPFISAYNNNDLVKPLLYVLAFVPILKNAVNINIHLDMRDRDFRRLSLIQIPIVLIDLLFSITLVVLLDDPIAVIWGLLISEAFKMIVSHLIYKELPKFNFSFYEIRDISRYGRWIWGNGISNFISSQFDKILSLNILNSVSLGYYQMSSKLSQLALFDTNYTISNYLFPNFSNVFREDKKNLKKCFTKSFFLILLFSLSIMLLLMVNNELIIILLLGNEWAGMADILNFMLVSTGLAGIMSIFVSFLRAIGNPKSVTVISYIQLVIYIPLVIILGYKYGLNGLLISNIIGYAIGLGLLIIKCKTYFRITIKDIYLSLIVGFILLLNFGVVTSINNHLIIFAISGISYIGIIICLYKIFKDIVKIFKK